MDEAHVEALLARYKAEGGTIGQADAAELQDGIGRLEAEEYEEAEAAHGDRAFFNLQRRLSRFPEQVGAGRGV